MFFSVEVMVGTTFLDGQCQTINIFKMGTQSEVRGSPAQGKKKKENFGRKKINNILIVKLWL